MASIPRRKLVEVGAVICGSC